MKSSLVGIILLATTMYALRAEAECNCVSISADVGGAVQELTIKADNLFARGEYDAALELYVQGYRVSKEAVFLYAQAVCQWNLGKAGEAEVLFRQYLDVGGALKYKARAEGALRDIGAGVTTGLGAVGRLGAGVVGGVTGTVGGAVDGTIDGATDVGAGAVGIGGSLRKKAKPPKVAKGAAILLGVVAVAAVGALSVQGLQASFKDDVDFDKRFGLSMGLTGAVVGGTAVYLWGLTAVAPAAAGAVPCVTQTEKRRGVIAPMAYRSGGGVTAAFSF